MTFLFQIEYREFIDQMNKWGFHSTSLSKVCIEETENTLAFFLPVKNVTFVTVLKKEEISEIDLLNFQGLSLKGRRFEKIEELRKEIELETKQSLFQETQFQKDVRKRREELNAKQQPSD